ncbi:MAG: hypothetical protein ACM3X4_00760 [Ignavibacteriales bacterium]
MTSQGEKRIDPALFESEYLGPIHRVGTITSVLVFLALFLPSTLLYLVYGVFPKWSALITGFALAMTYAVPFYFSEPISYYPIIGNAGWYMTATTGNGSNLRVPCAAVAQEIAGVREGTMEGELVATVGIAVSVFMSVIGVLIGALTINWIQAFFPPWLTRAFSTYLLPAVFGAVWGQFILRGFRYAPIAAVLAWVPIALKWPGAYQVIFCVVGTMLAGWAMLRFLKVEA